MLIAEVTELHSYFQTNFSEESISVIRSDLRLVLPYCSRPEFPNRMYVHIVSPLCVACLSRVILFLYCHVWGVCVTNNNGFWIGFIGTSLLLTVNYNSSQSMTGYDSLHSLLEYECLLFHCDELLLTHWTPLRMNLWLNWVHEWTLFYNFARTE
jgi:hypothetical protein